MLKKERNKQWRANIANILLAAILIASVFWLFMFREMGTECITNPLGYLEKKYNVTTQIITQGSLILYPNDPEDNYFKMLKSQWEGELDFNN